MKQSQLTLGLSAKCACNFDEFKISWRISFKRASLTAILVTDLQASIALYLKPSSSSILNWYGFKTVSSFPTARPSLSRKSIKVNKI